MAPTNHWHHHPPPGDPGRSEEPGKHRRELGPWGTRTGKGLRGTPAGAPGSVFQGRRESREQRRAESRSRRSASRESASRARAAGKEGEGRDSADPQALTSAHAWLSGAGPYSSVANISRARDSARVAAITGPERFLPTAGRSTQGNLEVRRAGTPPPAQRAGCRRENVTQPSDPVTPPT